MKGSVKALIEQGWDGLKLDSCSQFNNLTQWALLINESQVQPRARKRAHTGEGSG